MNRAERPPNGGMAADQTFLTDGAPLAAAPAPTPQSHAEALYGAQPGVRLDKPASAQVAELRNDPARKLHPASARYGSREIEDLTTTFAPLARRSQIDKEVAELKEGAGDMDATPAELSAIVSEARSLVLHKPTADQVKAMKTDSLRQLREKYGDDTSRVFDLAEQLANRNPRFTNFLVNTGARNSPRVVLTMAEMALRAAGRGELRAKGKR